MYTSGIKASYRLETQNSKNRVTKPTQSNHNYNSEQIQALTRMCQTQSLSKLLKQGQTLSSALHTQNNGISHVQARNNTPKSCRSNQEYFFFTKTRENSTRAQLSQLVSRTMQTNSSKNNLSKEIQDTQQHTIKRNISEKKHNLLSLDSEKLLRKLKMEKPKTQQEQIQKKIDEQPQKVNKQQQNNIHLSLDDFVTQVTPTITSKSPLISPFKQTKSLSPNNRALSTQRRYTYYVASMYQALKYGSHPQTILFKDHAQQTFNCVGFCLQLKDTNINEIEKRKITLPFKNTKFNKTVVFDLDETLIHCNEIQTAKADIFLPITFPTGDTVQAGINIRPWAKQILLDLAQICEVVIFTASHQCYASKVIQYLDNKSILSAQLFRDKCIQTNDGVHVKDLRIINRDLKDIILIDNAAYSFGQNLENGIPIIPYYDDKQDTELKQLYEFLVVHVLPAYDCRTIIKDAFKLREYQYYMSPKSAIEKLYS